ncbi:hypothetical protein ASPACDRAFT_1888706 [Aspergillus aculeatus ATCC 16872]|uniref:Flavin reductase like domain-containing protein n=1 Tax=Aspergillus aculeatus (strain ATCC 16872 / CBS 172.66 / WB 5094) TaxID=690307 RepID=A0A1L9WS99_ASPA1|nr:uncharacterized protein ASPACDRAFT_1888706 [Aspergillus aculeatus ATCC 16872]OJJ99071.1 hypothetical protein ASPACDRAFT_1888706 [Aspergillus aculeatus ATCC 16872]
MATAAKRVSRLITSRPMHLIGTPALRPFTRLRMNSSAAAAAAAAATPAAPAPSSSSPGEEAAAATKAAQANYKIVQDISNFAQTEASRLPFDHTPPAIEVTQSPYPSWTYGQGVPDNGASAGKTHREIDPYDTSRPAINNYRLLVSGIAPRPVGFLSTVSADGTTKNLAPFSYFQVVDHDPPLFVVGFSSRPGRAKDTYRNLQATGECVINTVSEGMIEAVNATAVDAPYGVSEWEVSGLTEAPSATVAPSRVRESVFSIEGQVLEIKEFAAHSPGMSVSAVVLIKATRFWVEEGAVDAEGSHIDLEKLRPVAQLGGVAYGRITSTFERPRTKWGVEVEKSEALRKLERRNEDGGN